MGKLQSACELFDAILRLITALSVTVLGGLSLALAIELSVQGMDAIPPNAPWFAHSRYFATVLIIMCLTNTAVLTMAARGLLPRKKVE